MKTKSFARIESLEQRIAPAAVTINPALHTATWTDFDGDLVSLKYSSAQPPTFTTHDSGAGLIVDKIALNAADHSNAAFALTVTAAAGGDGHIDLGHIDAAGVPLKSWRSPAATIAEFDCGDGKAGIGKFVSGTLGAVPYTKFNASGGDGFSDIDGDIGSFTVRGDVAAAPIRIQAANVGGHIGAMKFLGSLHGDAPGSQLSGYVSISAATVDSIFIGGSVIGGNDDSEGRLALANGEVGKVTVKGDIVGGTGFLSGNVGLDDAALAVVLGNIVGGSNTYSGELEAEDAGTLRVGGSVLGGIAQYTGNVFAHSADRIAIKGSVIGGQNTVATDNLNCGTVETSFGDLNVLTIGGDLIAGSYASGEKISYNGAVIVSGTLGTAKIKGSIIGHDGYEALILAEGTAPATPGNYDAIGKLVVGGDVSFGYVAAGHQSVSNGFDFRIGNAINPDAGIGSVTVGGDWFHSNLSAGINDAASNGVQIGVDTRDAGDPARQAIIGPVAIKGYILDNPSSTGYSGFMAEKIASITAAGIKVFKSGDAPHSLDAYAYVDVAEI